jgi:hypothetical protein
MKDSEFTELLNLYLDHEITAADAARLEAEVQSNPARRRVYQDYCRMQKACKMLAQDFASDSATADRKIVAFEQTQETGHRRSVGLYVAGGFAAAAACVAIVFVGHHRLSESTPNDASQTAMVATTSAAPTTSTVAATPVSAPAHRGIERQTLNSLSLRNTNSDALVLASTAQNDPHFAWLQDVRLSPVQAPVPADQLRFNTQPEIQIENRTFSGDNKSQSDLEHIAVRFQR